MNKTTAFVLKGYPRLSETFIAQEILGLERAGLPLEIISLRAPTDKERHPVHDEIRAQVTYLPEYVRNEPLRCLKAWIRARKLPGYAKAWRAFSADHELDRTPNRRRRFVQAMVLAAERGPDLARLHAHFIHTPASVTRYAAIMLGLPWSCSAHAKDIWTSEPWDLARKLAEARWTVTCTRSGHEQLVSLAEQPPRVHLSYHGLDLERFAPFPGRRHVNDGSDEADPVRIISVGRAVPKKGYETLLAALAKLPGDLHWRFDHVGGGELRSELMRMADEFGIGSKVNWCGPQPQTYVLELYRHSDIFVLPSKVAGDGDRDGLPNVLVEAASQQLALVSTTLPSIREFITSDVHGVLVEADAPDDLALALQQLACDPARRTRLGKAADERVRGHFDHVTSIRQLMGLFDAMKD